MPSLWIKILRRPVNQLRLLALLAFALLAGLSLVVSLTTNRYTLATFSAKISAGWADLHTFTRGDPRPALRGQPALQLVAAPVYSFSLVTESSTSPGSEEESPWLAAIFDLRDVGDIPHFLTGDDPAGARQDSQQNRLNNPQPELGRNQAWVSAGWARRNGVEVGDHVTLKIHHPAGAQTVGASIVSIARPLDYLLAPEALYIALDSRLLPSPGVGQRWMVLGSLGEAHFDGVARALAPIAEQLTTDLGGNRLLIAEGSMVDEDKGISPYALTLLLSRAASAFMSLLACLGVACSLWLATSLYRRAVTSDERQPARLLLGVQLVALYWIGVALGTLLGSLAPNMLALPGWGLDGAHRSDTQLMLVALGLLAGLAIPVMPALAWVRGRPHMRELRVSRRGNQIRAGLSGSVGLSIMLGLILYAASWWPGESLLLYNTLAAMVTGVIAGVGPLAVSWNKDSTYLRAARSAGLALLICLLLTATFILVAGLLIFWAAQQISGVPEQLFGLLLLVTLFAYGTLIVVALLLALTVGSLSGVLVVAFWRRTRSSDSETMAENTMRIEGLLLLSRMVLAVVIGLAIRPASSAEAITSILNLYLLAIIALSVLLRTWPTRILIWSMLSSLVDAAAISTLVALDGGLDSPFYLLYFVALLAVTMRFNAIASLAASIEFSLLYLVALVSAESWGLIAGEGTRQASLSNRVLLMLCFGLLAALLASEHQRALRRLDQANQRLLEDMGLRRELEIARQVQQNLFPKELPQLAGLRMAARCLPAREMGGDFYDVVALDERHLALVVCDVSGKGVPAAMVMAMARSAFRAEILDGRGPALALSKANLTLQGAGRGIFTAAQYGLFDLQDGTLTLSSAGQLAPMLRRDETITLLQPPGHALPLGVITGGCYEEQRYQLLPGDLLLFYTDGVVEAMSRERELFGFERLEALLRRYEGQADEQLLEQLIAEIGRFTDHREQHDDITLVAIELTDIDRDATSVL